jgi:Type II intron maturase
VLVGNSKQYLVPIGSLKKKLRDLGVLHKTFVRPIGQWMFASLKDYDIINWYSIKAIELWNYYSCVDSTGI